MCEVNIRYATAEDSEIILSFIKGLAKHVGQLEMVTATIEELKKALFADDSHINVVIACVGDVPAGFALYYKTYSTFVAKHGYFLEDLFVLPEFRSKGIGTKLLEYVVSGCKKEGYCKVEWTVTDKNQRAVDFYKKFGAKLIAHKSICSV